MALSGILLAGGLGTRLGMDKRMARVRGMPLLDRALALLEPVADEIVIVTRDETPRRGRARMLRDEIREGGPLAGLLTGLRGVSHPRALVLPVDMPLISPALLSHLVAVSTGWMITVPRWIRLEPLVGVYSIACLPLMETYLEGGRRSAADFVRLLGPAVCYIPEEELARFGDPSRLFLNVNTPGDLLRAEGLLEQAETRARAVSGAR